MLAVILPLLKRFARGVSLQFCGGKMENRTFAKHF